MSVVNNIIRKLNKLHRALKDEHDKAKAESAALRDLIYDVKHQLRAGQAGKSVLYLIAGRLKQIQEIIDGN